MSLLLALVGGGPPGTTAPAVSAGLTWSAAASAPLVGVNAPTVAASFAWASNPLAPTYGTTTGAVSASLAWSATISAPLVGVTAPDVQGAFAWSAFADVPSTGGVTDTTADAVSAGLAWNAQAGAPQIESAERVESIGNYAGFDQRTPSARARFGWGVRALPPRIGAKPRPVVAVRVPSVACGFAWRAACRAPVALQITNRPALMRESPRPALMRTEPPSLIRS